MLPARDGQVLIRCFFSSIQLVFDGPRFAKLDLFAKQCPDEVLNLAGNRKRTFKNTVSVSESDLADLFLLKTILFYTCRCPQELRIGLYRRVQDVPTGTVRRCYCGIEQVCWLPGSVVFSRKFDF